MRLLVHNHNIVIFSFFISFNFMTILEILALLMVECVYGSVYIYIMKSHGFCVRGNFTFHQINKKMLFKCISPEEMKVPNVCMRARVCVCVCATLHSKRMSFCLWAFFQTTTKTKNIINGLFCGFLNRATENCSSKRNSSHQSDSCVNESMKRKSLKPKKNQNQ